MIRKLFKRLGILLGCVILVPLLLLIVGALFLPKDKIKDQVASRLAAATGAEVTLGDASVKWLPRLAVSLDGGSITGTGPALAAASGSSNRIQSYQVQLSALDVQVGFRPLLQKRIEVGSLTIKGPSLRTTWDDSEVLAEEFELQINDLDLPLEAAQKAAGASGHRAPPGEVIPEDLALAFTCKVGTLVLQQVAYNEVEFAGDLDALILTVDSFLAKRSSGTLTGSGEIDYERNPWGEMDFSVQAMDVPAQDLLAPWVPDLAQRLTGEMNGEASGTYTLGEQDTALSSLSITGDLGCAEGVLDAADWLREVSPYLGDRQDLVRVHFKELSHAFRIDGGKYHLEELHIDGHDTDWTGSGWVGLEGTIDAYLQVKLPGNFTPDLGQWSFLAETLRDADGRVTLDLHLTGLSARPGVKLVLGNL